MTREASQLDDIKGFSMSISGAEITGEEQRIKVIFPRVSRHSIR
jgi:hypothetical protein